MTDTDETTRRYRVHARHLDRHHARVLLESSFEAAAVAYIEDLALAGAIDDDPAIRVIVHDIETGHEHCFAVDPESGETASCG